MLVQPKIIGLETEYGMMCYKGADYQGCLVDHGVVLRGIVENLPEGAFAINASSSQIYFLSNGAKLHKDIGEHIENTTPEASSIDQVVEYDASGDELILFGLEKLIERGVIGSYRLNKHVTDEQGNYFGAHASYLAPTEVDPKNETVREVLATHYATNSVYAGAGRVSRQGFNVAQKLFRLNTVYGYSASGRSRPLVDTRNQPLADSSKWRRIHDSHGDATILPLTTTLRLTGTSILLQLLEHDIDLSDLILDNPMRAMMTVAHDSSLKKNVKMANGKRMRPIEIQTEIALRGRDLQLKDKLTEEDARHVETLIQVCDDLSTDPDRLIGQLDWPSKKYSVERKYPDANPENVLKRRARALYFEQLNGGTGQKMRRRVLQREGRTDKVASGMGTPPENTRAAQRGKIVRALKDNWSLRSRVYLNEWDHVVIDDKSRSMEDPYQTSYPEIDRLLGVE